MENNCPFCGCRLALASGRIPFCFGCELYETPEGWRKLTLEELAAYPKVKPPILYPDLTEEEFGKWWNSATPQQRHDRLGYSSDPEVDLNVDVFGWAWEDFEEDVRRDLTTTARFTPAKDRS
jgi:hypothetical protein